MRALIITIFVLALGFAFFPSPNFAYAARSSAGEDALRFLDATAKKAGLTERDPSGENFAENEVYAIIGRIVNAILGVVGIIFFILIFWAGARWMTAGGNDDVINESKSTIKAAVIGITITLSAFLITNFVFVQLRKVNPAQQPDWIDEPLGSCTYLDRGLVPPADTTASGITQNDCINLGGAWAP